MHSSSKYKSLQQYVHKLFEGNGQQSPYSSGLNWFLFGLITFNVLAFGLQTVDTLDRRFGPYFDFVLYVSMGLFTLEYLLRVWSAGAHESGLYSRPIRGRLRYVVSLLPMLDLLVLLAFYVPLIPGLDLRFLRLLRLLWILQITRYLPAMGTLGRVLKRERRVLAAVMTVMLIMLFMSSSLIYLLEHEQQPEDFASVPHAMWWGIATLTTVGYGDVVPVSPTGKALGVVIMLLGIGTFALPAGILASAFTEERKRRDFMLTWNLIAQVPSFSFLTAKDIAGIAALLHPREMAAKEIVFHKGEEAGSMFFIVSGELEVELQPEPIRLKKGDFFGEVALVFHRERTATVITLSRVELLELDAQDLHRLFKKRSKLRQRIMEEAERRAARSADDDAGSASV